MEKGEWWKEVIMLLGWAVVLMLGYWIVLGLIYEYFP